MNEKGLIYTASQQEIREAIVKFKGMFPEDIKLQETSEQEILDAVLKQRESLQGFKFSMENTAGLPELQTSPKCAQAIALVVIYCIAMGLSACGCDVDNDVIARSAVEGVAKMIGENQQEWDKYLDHLINAQSMRAKADAIWDIIKFAWDKNIFTYVFDKVKEHMSWTDWVIMGLAAMAELLAAIASDGALLIVKIATMAPQVANIIAKSMDAREACKF